jgi:hypothetical protein
MDPYQGNNSGMPSLSYPTTNKAYVKFIGGEIAHTYFQNIYCKVKQWIQRIRVIQLNQDIGMYEE